MIWDKLGLQPSIRPVDADLSADRMTQLFSGAAQVARELAEQTNSELKGTINNLVHRVELKAERTAIQLLPLV